MKVLIIDDSASARGLLRELITGVGHDVIEAVNGDSGLDLIRKESPNLVFLDLLMPGKSGFEVLEELRDKGLDRMPVLVLTADIQKEVREECLAKGAVEVLNKPLNRDEFLAALSKYLQP